MRSLIRIAFIAAGLAAISAFAQERQVYDLPQGAHPHDVAPAPDGSVWYTAQQQGALGILDTETGKVRQVPLGEGSSPHAVIQGPGWRCVDHRQRPQCRRALRPQGREDHGLGAAAGHRLR